MSDDLISRVAQDHCANLIVKRSGGSSSAVAKIALAMTVRTSEGNFKMDPAALQALDIMRRNNEIRTDLVSGVKTQIQNGTYETPEKFSQACDALLDDLKD